MSKAREIGPCRTILLLPNSKLPEVGSSAQVSVGERRPRRYRGWYNKRCLMR